MTIPNILSIAGVDPSGGAGIAADLKTFAALGAYGMAAVTATTRTGRPQRSAKALPWRSIRRSTSAPTVPSPAMPSFRGATITKQTCRKALCYRRLARGTTLCNVSMPLSRNRRTPRAAWRIRCSFSTMAMRT